MFTLCFRWEVLNLYCLVMLLFFLYRFQKPSRWQNGRSMPNWKVFKTRKGLEWSGMMRPRYFFTYCYLVAIFLKWNNLNIASVRLLENALDYGSYTSVIKIAWISNSLVACLSCFQGKICTVLPLLLFIWSAWLHRVVSMIIVWYFHTFMTLCELS